MTDKKKWAMPKWMEPYRPYLTDGRRAEELMSGTRATIQINAPLALIQMGMEAEIGLLGRLRHQMELTRCNECGEPLDLEPCNRRHANRAATQS